MAQDKNIRKDKHSPNSKLEFGEELNIPPRLRPSKTGSVAQNTAKPIGPEKKKH